MPVDHDRLLVFKSSPDGPKSAAVPNGINGTNHPHRDDERSPMSEDDDELPLVCASGAVL